MTIIHTFCEYISWPRTVADRSIRFNRSVHRFGRDDNALGCALMKSQFTEQTNEAYWACR